MGDMPCLLLLVTCWFIQHVLLSVRDVMCSGTDGVPYDLTTVRYINVLHCSSYDNTVYDYLACGLQPPFSVPKIKIK